MMSGADTNAEAGAGNEEMVTWAYRLFLDREPESLEAVKSFAGRDRTSDIRFVFQGSDEYRARNAFFLRDVRSKDRRAIESHASDSDKKLICDFVASVWMDLGREMPHWSVLSSNQFRPDNISASQNEFYDSGSDDVDVLLSAFARTGMDPCGIGHVVEFGCGVGRVTKFLADEFAHVSAIDISSSHLLLAEQRLGGLKIDNVAFIQAEFPDFGLPDAYDLWVSRIVLQHNPPPIIQMILERALTGLRAGGVAVFQVPTYAPNYTFSARQYVESLGEKTRGIEMHCLPMEDVFEIVCDSNCVPLEVTRDDAVSDPGWISTQFVVRKR